MGCSMSQEDKAAFEKSKALDDELKTDKERLRNEVKLLLLGAGESGKSTIVKQMKIIHENGFSKDECESYREVVFVNLIQSMQNILRAMDKLGIEFANPESKLAKTHILDLGEHVESLGLPCDISASIKKLWADEGVKSAFARRNEYYIVDSADYFFDGIDRISEPVYVPSENDILRCRIKTTGINETQFVYKELQFRMFDVGGQRSERKKWIHCFENVTAIIFCVALSEYDMVMLEDETTNRMEESLKLFDSICNSKWFVQTSIILFLNKMDLFQEKITHTPITACFKDYTGDDSFEATSDFIQFKFEALNKTPETKTVYTHLTCATDTENVKFVFAAVTDIIFQNNLRNCGLL